MQEVKNKRKWEGGRVWNLYAHAQFFYKSKMVLTKNINFKTNYMHAFTLLKLMMQLSFSQAFIR